MEIKKGGRVRFKKDKRLGTVLCDEEAEAIVVCHDNGTIAKYRREDIEVITEKKEH